MKGFRFFAIIVLTIAFPIFTSCGQDTNVNVDSTSSLSGTSWIGAIRGEKVTLSFSKKNVVATFDDETLSTGVYSYNSPNLVGNLYELQYYPVFYVIGKDKTIILKEASLDRVDVFLKSIIQLNNNLTIN